MATEKCMSCGRRISESETPFISDDRVVCQACYAKLHPKPPLSKNAKFAIICASAAAAIAVAAGGYGYHVHEKAVTEEDDKLQQQLMKDADAEHLSSQWRIYHMERDTERSKLDSDWQISIMQLRGYAADQQTSKYNEWASIREVEDHFVQQCEDDGQTVDKAKERLKEMQAKYTKGQ
jgi:DNA-directed RNA polymerase subunit RPC12/RpoP